MNLTGDTRLTDDVQKAADWLKQGGVLAYPTETLWGLGCDALNAQAVERVFAIKQRSLKQPASVLVRDVQHVQQFSSLDPAMRQFLHLIWPSALTVILPSSFSFPQGVGDGEFVGYRQSPDSSLAELFHSFDQPLLTTSANPSGEAPSEDVESLGWLPDDVLVFAPVKKLRASRGSTIIKVNEGCYEVLREGDFKLNHWQAEFADFALKRGQGPTSL